MLSYAAALLFTVSSGDLIYDFPLLLARRAGVRRRSKFHHCRESPLPSQGRSSRTGRCASWRTPSGAAGQSAAQATRRCGRSRWWWPRRTTGVVPQHVVDAAPRWVPRSWVDAVEAHVAAHGGGRQNEARYLVRRRSENSAGVAEQSGGRLRRLGLSLLTNNETDKKNDRCCCRRRVVVPTAIIVNSDRRRCMLVVVTEIIIPAQSGNDCRRRRAISGPTINRDWVQSLRRLLRSLFFPTQHHQLLLDYLLAK